MRRRHQSANLSDLSCSDISNRSLRITSYKARLPLSGVRQQSILLVENQILRSTFRKLQNVIIPQTHRDVKAEHQTTTERVRRLSDISRFYGLEYSRNQPETNISEKVVEPGHVKDERRENEALKLAVKQLTRLISNIRISLNLLRDEYTVLRVRLVRFARRWNLSFLPSICFQDLVSVYLRAGYYPVGLTPGEIKNLPVETASAALLQEHCCICMCPFESQVKRLPCNHRFHVRCVDQWLELRNSCPLCVRKVLIL